MYCLPENFDPAFLQGREVESVCFTAYQVNIYFDGKIWVQIEGCYKLFHGETLLESASEFPLSESALIQLIGAKIIGVTFTAKSGDIEFTLESGHRLLIDGGVGPYESYKLFDGQKEVIV
jgi:hypothetical protein